MRRPVFPIIALCALAGGSGPASAGSHYGDRNFSVGPGTGRLGTGLDGAYFFNDAPPLRANLNRAIAPYPGVGLETDFFTNIPVSGFLPVGTTVTVP